MVALVATAWLVASALAGGLCAYRVTTLAASGPGSLAAAIEAADAHGSGHGERSRITFSVAGTISLATALPPITVPLEIDGTSAPGYAGAPVVEIDGGGTSAAGLAVYQAAGGSRILGLAIGGFGTGVALAGSHSSLCSNFIGTDLSGSAADPNGVGIEVIGDDETVGGESCCGGGAGNLISGNAQYGIVIAGSGNHVAGNLIGTDPTGTGPLPNGAAGIRVAGTATATLIGGAGATGSGNTIAFNRGPGVLVEPGATGTEVIANSIFGNEGLGIEVAPGGAAPASPTLTALPSGFGNTEEGAVVRGTEAGEPLSTYSLEFFAGETCDPSGQARTFLGAIAVTTDAAGEASFETVPLAPLPEGTRFITATATGGASASTSEFSACLGQAKPVMPQPPLVAPLAATASAVGVRGAAPSGPAPINGSTVTIEPETGKVTVMLPGEKRFRPISELESVPIGSVVDATAGKARIASATTFGTVQSAAFFGGRFEILQPEGRTLTTMRLLSAGFEPCATAASGSAATAPAAEPGANRLWGSGKGSFRTEGQNGSATVRGTTWFVADRCEGTFFKVNRGIVTVRDFTKQTTVAVRAGQTYLAEPPA